MPAHTAVGIDNNFSSGETAIPLRPANNEAAGGVYMKNCILVEKLRGNDGLNDTVNNGFFQFAVFDVGTVLSRDHDIFNFYGLAIAIFYGYLRLAIGPQKTRLAAFTNFGQVLNQAVGHLNRERHQFGSLVAGIAEHHALIASALFLVEALAFGYALGNVR